MIDEVAVQRLDRQFRTKSKVFQATNTIIISTGLDEWKIVLLDSEYKRKYERVALFHKNILRCTEKYHQQGLRSNLFQCYDSIFTHKGVLKQIHSPRHTYKTYKSKKKGMRIKG